MMLKHFFCYKPDKKSAYRVSAYRVLAYRVPAYRVPAYRVLFSLLLSVVFFATATTQLAAKSPADRAQFLDFFAIMQLVSKAKNAGYKDEQLENLSLKDGWQNIELKNVGLAYDRFLAERIKNPSFVLEKLPKIEPAPQVDLLAFLVNLLDKQKSYPSYITLRDVMDDLQKHDQENLSAYSYQNNVHQTKPAFQPTQ